MEVIKMSSIGQFRQATRQAIKKLEYLEYQGFNPDYVVEAQGTEKIHGTNIGIIYDGSELYVQSRKQILTPENTNAGAYDFVMNNKEKWIEFLNSLRCENTTIVVYGEFCGGNIQVNSCVSGCDKMIILFKYYKILKNDEYQLIEYPKDLKTELAYFVKDFETFNIKIDLKNPSPAIIKMTEYVDLVEHNSPIAKFFGKPENIGEGIVWSFEIGDELFTFKTKGEKHSKSKVKTLKIVDSKLEKAKQDFVNNYAIKDFRLEQIFQEIFGINNEKAIPSREHIGTFIKLYLDDVQKEEYDILESLNLTLKDVNGLISKVLSKWFLEKLKTI